MSELTLNPDQATAIYRLLVRHDARTLGFDGPEEAVPELNRTLDRLRGDLINVMEGVPGSRSDG